MLESWNVSHDSVGTHLQSTILSHPKSSGHYLNKCVLLLVLILSMRGPAQCVLPMSLEQETGAGLDFLSFTMLSPLWPYLACLLPQRTVSTSPYPPIHSLSCHWGYLHRILQLSKFLLLDIPFITVLRLYPSHRRLTSPECLLLEVCNDSLLMASSHQVSPNCSESSIASYCVIIEVCAPYKDK